MQLTEAKFHGFKKNEVTYSSPHGYINIPYLAEISLEREITFSACPRCAFSGSSRHRLASCCRVLFAAVALELDPRSARALPLTCTLDVFEALSFFVARARLRRLAARAMCAQRSRSCGRPTWPCVTQQATRSSRSSCAHRPTDCPWVQWRQPARASVGAALAGGCGEERCVARREPASFEPLVATLAAPAAAAPTVGHFA